MFHHLIATSSVRLTRRRSKMETTTYGAPAGTTSKSNLIQFPRISDDEQSGKESTITTFPRCLFNNCVSFLGNKKPKKHRFPPRVQVPDRKIVQIPQILPLWHSKMASSIDASPYKWPHDNSFDPKTTALVIIDMQKDCGYFPLPRLNIQTAMKIFKSAAHPTLQLNTPISPSKSLTDILALCLPYSHFNLVTTVPSMS
jgi:hypothetical protein